MSLDTLASRLKHARDVRKVTTQAALAAIAKVSQGTIGNIEGGSRGGAVSLAAIAHALNISYWWLRDGDGEMDVHPRQPDAEALADAFDALPSGSPQDQDRREALYRLLMVQIDETRRAALASAPAPGPAVKPTAAPRRKR